MPYFTHNGAKLHYEEAGTGQPLVFLHGASWDLRQWARQMAHFSPRYRVVALDARGHGQSTLPPGEVPPEAFWQDVNALLNHLDIEQAVLCGLSLGGHTALQTAIHAPARVKGLILMGTPCSNRFNLFERICVPINRACMGWMPMGWIAWSIAAALGGASPETKAYIREVVGAMDHDAFCRVWKGVTSMESRAQLPQIACPTLILIGDRDRMTGRQQAFLHRSIAGSELVTIRGANHGTNLDNPEQVEGEMEKFLEKHRL